MKKSILILSFLMHLVLRADVAGGAEVEPAFHALGLKPQMIAANRMLRQRDVPLLPKRKYPQDVVLNRSWFTQYPFLSAAESKEDNLLATGYFPVYVTLSRNMVLKFYFLKQLEQYFKAHGHARGMHVGTLFSYIARHRKDPLRVELNLGNVFVVPMLNPKRIRSQRQFEPKNFEVQDWPEIAPYVSQKTLTDLTTVLNNFVASDVYDENIVVQFSIPKNRANDLIIGKLNNAEYSIEELYNNASSKIN